MNTFAQFYLSADVRSFQRAARARDGKPAADGKATSAARNPLALVARCRKGQRPRALGRRALMQMRTYTVVQMFIHELTTYKEAGVLLGRDKGRQGVRGTSEPGREGKGKGMA